ncbi:CopD family protein [Kitasatospora viridis]|uniref:Putative copper resistance protein D/copper transport protein n=1 Tax=Kitasatospora viridis TaxID=281105 RepID=A0A561TVR5_9ACTN|nr:CopD family protein [Kitasatospora viridis]TWF91194.1 putative copper resistance protein D/copper transport protein [Kitasatospora viridis]
MNSALSAATTAGYTMPPLWRTVTKSGYFLGLCGAIGATVTYATTVRPALRARSADAGDAAVLRRRSARYLAGAGVLLLVAGYFQLAARVARAGKGMPFADALAPDRIWHFLRAPAAKGAWIPQGTIYLVQNGVLLLTAVTLAALFAPAARRRTDALALLALPLSLATTLIAAIPAAAPKNADAVLDLVFDQVHIIAGTVWLGGLALLVALAGTRGRLGGSAGLLWADLWRRFGLVAMVCVGAVVVSGLWMSWRHVGAIDQLWTTGYGLALLVKLLLVAGLVTAGAVNQLWLMPRIARARRADDTASLLRLTLRHFPQVVWGEVALGLGVLVALPYLSGSARTEAHSPQAASSGAVFAAGAALAAALAVSLYATAKTSDALARRQVLAANCPTGHEASRI